MKERAYHEKVNIENEKKLRELTAELPRFCREFFIGIEPTTSSRTRIAYAYDLGVFLITFMRTILLCRKRKLQIFPFPSWSRSQRWILRNI